MPRRRNETSEQRRLRFEQFEKRLVMSAQAVASLVPDVEIAGTEITQQVVSLESPTTQAANVAAQYGFDGSGQTVAVIDSGIAWDHYALGGGYGEGNKVVGGWDFAENDDNPYDDGPAGYHGSHIAGIIGSTDDQYKGVSSGVDLVGLRVFDDAGAGDLAWVEQALQWVHDHKDDFANPITTVNLSLGTDWNADTMPEWATLEEEFAQLEADGLFISVAAGNAFGSFGEAGLSYPAVSDYVVPVASHDAQGNISDFSQRNDGVLAAPGESIRSTVPDHLFGGTSEGRFLGSTGTSMSAPYVAGASAVLRQANEFMGVTDVTQDLLHQQFRETADQVYDSVTGGYFYRINLDAALASVVQDMHSDAMETATDAGLLGGGEVIEGTIGKIADVDAFEFTALHTGQMTLDFEVTDNLVPLVDVVGVDAVIDGHKIAFDVVAGQKYNFAVATADGSGHYKIRVGATTVNSNTGGETQTGTGGGASTGETNPGTGSETETGTGESTPAETVDWGQVTSDEFLDQVVDGESSYSLIATRDGILTVESSTQSGESLEIEVYDSEMNLIGSAVSENGNVRLDVEARAGESFIIKATGQTRSVDFRVTNLVSLENGFLFVHGTDQDDDISFSADSELSLSVNGVEYHFNPAEVNQIEFTGHGGTDSVDLALGAEDDRVDTRTDGVTVKNARYNLNAIGFERVSVGGGGGYDMVSMVGSSGDDSVTTGESSGEYSTVLSGTDYRSEASGFELVNVVATDGVDSATLSGTAGNDRFISRGERSWLKTDGSTVIVDGFDAIAVEGGGGYDSASLYDTAGDDQFVINPNSATMTSDSLQVSVDGFERINAFSKSGNDSVTMHGSAGDDTFNYRDSVSQLNGDGFASYAQGFADVNVISGGGEDRAQVHDTAGNDTFYSDRGETEMISAGLSVGTSGFKQVDLISNQGGFDRAFLQGSDGNDVVSADADSSQLTLSDGQSTRVVGMNETQIDTGAGIDSSFLTGTDGRDVLNASYSEVELETTLRMLRMTNVEHTNFDGNGGFDEVLLKEMEDLDLLESLGDEAKAYLQDHTVTAKDFAILEAKTVDDAIAQYDMEAVDYLYMLRGKWAQR
jgi:subtilisin family serine protease